MPALSKEQLETMLSKVERSHEFLIGLTTSLSFTHKEYLEKAHLFTEKEWQHQELVIYEHCSTVLSILNEIEQSLSLLEPEEHHELKKIYESRNISGCLKGWKLYAKNTITVIDLGQNLAFMSASKAGAAFEKQLALMPAAEAVRFLEKRMSDSRYYLELVIGRFPDCGNYFVIPTAYLLQKKALMQLHLDCNKYTQILNNIYLSAKKQEQWHEANDCIDKLDIHFESQLKDTKRYEPDSKDKIAQIERVLRDIGYEKSKLAFIRRSEKSYPRLVQADPADEAAAKLATLNL